MSAVTATHPGKAAAPESAASVAFSQTVWFVAIAGVAFLVPFLLTTVVSVNHDLYYLLYFAAALAVLTAYVVANDVNLIRLFTQNWKLSLVLGGLAAAFVVRNVLVREDSTARPSGAYFAFEVVWRGLAYGTVDALLLTAFPAAVAFTVLRSDLSSPARHAKFAGLALVLSMVITATYHLGYDQYREDGVAQPETGNVIISVPALAAANPIGSVVAHASMHVAAVTHSYETDVFLPPQTSAD